MKEFPQPVLRFAVANGLAFKSISNVIDTPAKRRIRVITPG